MQTLTLRWDHGGHTHERALAQGETVTLGRSTECDITLPTEDRTIHRRHAVIEWNEGAPLIRVLGRNGVRLESHGGKLRQTKSARFASTDRLTIGETDIEAKVRKASHGTRKLRCHNCDRIVDYAPEGMCVHCGHSNANSPTVFIQE